MNYLSPYVCIDGAMSGIVSGSIIVFGVMFFSGLVFGRAWCAWVCPMAGLSEVCMTVNRRTPPVKKLRIIRYCIFAVWFTILVACFVLAGGIKGVDPLHLSENVVSVDEPFKYITYYFVVLLFFILTLAIGKRGACHTICWMAPFLTAGYSLGKFLRLRQVRIGCGRVQMHRLPRLRKSLSDEHTGSQPVERRSN